MLTYYEFFAGGGMARMGLGSAWCCEFANDISPLKSATYLQNFPDSNYHFSASDINLLKIKEIPGQADLIWGSFPCQDLSLAGNGEGLEGARSGLIWKLLEIVEKLTKEHRGPKALVLENVTGLLNSRGGQDFYDILHALRAKGFVFGTLMMDAVHFLPQSRPRIFLVAVHAAQVPVSLSFINGRRHGNYLWTSPRLDDLWKRAPESLRENWVWWNVPAPAPRQTTIEDIVESDVKDWDSPEYTANLLRLMTPLHMAKVKKASTFENQVIGTLYRRTRVVDGIRAQRVEVRFDGVSGCLRTPTGGSSRQRLLIINGSSIKSRLLSAREAARLMGIPDSYQLPSSYNDAYQIAGDGVVVPVVRWISQHLLLPMLVSTSGKPTRRKEELAYA